MSPDIWHCAKEKIESGWLSSELLRCENFLSASKDSHIHSDAYALSSSRLLTFLYNQPPKYRLAPNTSRLAMRISGAAMAIS